MQKMETGQNQVTDVTITAKTDFACVLPVIEGLSP